MATDPYAAGRRTRSRRIAWAALAAIVLFGTIWSPTIAVESFCPSGSNPQPSVLWCDDFESTTTLSSRYFDYDSDGGDFVRVTTQGVGGTAAMQVVWQTGEDTAGSFARMFGRNPIMSHSHTTQDFRDIYWRQYVRTAAGWSGNPYKMSRATIFANGTTWAQGMIAHIWGDGDGDTLMIDPASGIDASNHLATTSYNDFAHLTWLGGQRATTPIFNAAQANQWFCIEAHAKLNTAGSQNGVFELWIDNVLQAQKTTLNWVGSWADYGINAVLFENYWNGGAPGPRTRYIDNIVISTTRIGCLNSTPQAPTGLRIVP